MNKYLIAAMAFTSVTFFCSCGDNSKPEDAKEAATQANDKKFEDTKMDDDAQWAVKAADGGMEEVTLGNLAMKNGASPKVKELGKMMVEDHSKANDELKALAQTKNITLPASLSEKRQKDVDNLSKKTGADFDKDYTKMMVDDHQDDISEFRKEADNGKDADIKSWASGKVPVLEHHLETAKAARDAVK